LRQDHQASRKFQDAWPATCLLAAKSYTMAALAVLGGEARETILASYPYLDAGDREGVRRRRPLP
jgi:hypothetical protein